MFADEGAAIVSGNRYFAFVVYARLVRVGAGIAQPSLLARI